MFKKQEYNQNDSYDPKTYSRSTPKKSQNTVDKSSNDGEFERLKENLINLTNKADDNKRDVDMNIQEILIKFDQFKSNQKSTETEILSLRGEIENLKQKVKSYSSLESKCETISNENRRLSKEIEHLKKAFEENEKTKETEFASHINAMEKTLCRQIRAMNKKIETAYDKRSKKLEEMLSRISVKDSQKSALSYEENLSESEDDDSTEYSEEDQSEEQTKLPLGTILFPSEHIDEKMDVNEPNKENEKSESNFIRDNKVEITPATPLFGINLSKPPPSFLVNNANALFGSNSTTSQSSLFRNNATIAQSSMFGGNSITATSLQGSIPMPAPSLLGNAKLDNTSFAMNSKSSLFGLNNSEASTNIFGASFGKTTISVPKSSEVESQQTTSKEDATQQKPLFASMFGSNSNVPSFGSLASSSGAEKGFGSISETKWQSGSKLFGNIGQTSKTDDADSGKEDNEHEADDHDPEFKPIIELPPLVQIVRDDENKEVLFKARCKLFRYINCEWKERGVGDMKIFKSNTDGAVTMVMRREQVHKLCCNQRVTRDSHKMTPMGNDKSACWVGPDFSEAESSIEKFAVKFNDKSIMDDFTKVISNAQSAL